MTKILIVEDNELNRDMLSRRLVRKGYSVEVAVDGKDGLDKVASTMPDAILMDISLPIMDGYELTRILKKDEKTRHIPIIALTANATVEDRSKALASGCDDFEPKPIDFERLFAKLATYAGQNSRG